MPCIVNLTLLRNLPSKSTWEDPTARSPEDANDRFRSKAADPGRTESTHAGQSLGKREKERDFIDHCFGHHLVFSTEIVSTQGQYVFDKLHCRITYG